MRIFFLLYVVVLLTLPCQGHSDRQTGKVRLIFDTDANNELDDQHALAYLLFNTSTFDIKGVTVNATHGGGDIDKHYLEAQRVMQLCAPGTNIPLLKGADKGYADILPSLNSADYDGYEAVDFIARSAKENSGAKLVILAVGKLTNVALVLKKYPETVNKLKVVWLGSNYPEPGEYNLKADTSALNSVLRSGVDFEMVTVRYGSPSGSDAVRVTKKEVNNRMPGVGPRLSSGIAGRHDGKRLFYTFGDYSVDLFKYINYKTNPPSRALFDLVAAAVLKNPEWGKKRQIAAPLYVAGNWLPNAETSRKITLWEDFDKDEIVRDFFQSMKSGAKGSKVEAVLGWDFEEGPTATDMSYSGDVRFDEGMVKMAGGKNAGLLRLQASAPCKERTIWLRLKLPEPESLNPGQVYFLKDGDLDLYYRVEKKEKQGYVFGIGCKIGTGNAIVEPVPAPQINLPGGLWVQVAVVTSEESGNRVLRLYCRPEFANKNLNNWVYTGKCFLPEKAISGQKELIASGSFHGSPDTLSIDEIRIYDQPLKFEELTNVWPVMKSFRNLNGVPGTVIDYIPANTGRFIAGSPSIVVMDDGTYIAKGDDYGPAVGISELVRIYRSADKGKTWKQISEVEGITWASLFTHKNALYMLGTTAGHGHGHVAIIKSTDGGITWTTPKDSNTGLIFSDLSYHTAPVPVVIHQGRIWRTMEDEKGPGGWGTNFRAFLMSAPVDSDLLKASNWTFSDHLGYDSTRLGGRFKGWLEGNTVITPDGNLANMLRVSMVSGGSKAALITYGKDGRKSSFDPKKGFIDFPGGSTKFHILFDEVSKRYWALSNAVPAKHQSNVYSESLVRNTLVLMTSKDLRNWEIADTVLYHPDIAKHAFQYPVLVFDGNDIVFVSRTAYDDGVGGAFRQHDVNYFTFHRIENFRKYAKN